MSELGDVLSPWTPDQVASLNGCQDASGGHPFTCRECSMRPPLVATEAGWICVLCGYTQDRALRSAANWAWLEGSLERGALKSLDEERDG